MCAVCWTTFGESEGDSLNAVLSGSVLSSLKHPLHVVSVVPVQRNTILRETEREGGREKDGEREGGREMERGKE